MEKIYLQEAFKALDMLNEADFDLDTTDGIDDLKSFRDNDDLDDNVDVIDPELSLSDLDDVEEPEEENYIGKVIVDCCVCHSKIYKNSEDIVIDEASGLANVDEECPFCYSMDGYKIIGEVASYTATQAEDEFEDDSVDETPDNTEDDLTADVEEEPEDDIEESLEMCPKCHKNPCECADSLEEDFEKVDIETSDEVMSMTSNEDGGVSVTTSPKENYIAPVSDEVQSEINPVNDEPSEEEPVDMPEEPVEDEISADEEDNVDIDIDDFSEDEFDELGESYLKKNYSNVNSFKTTSARMVNEKLIIEGTIGFTSGNKKKTQFIFEGKDITKRGMLRLIGENVQLSRGKKSFTLTGNYSKGKFITESLNYNYRAKDSNGTSQRVYGTVKVSK